jgi:hypothetical protein
MGTGSTGPSGLAAPVILATRGAVGCTPKTGIGRGNRPEMRLRRRRPR